MRFYGVNAFSTTPFGGNPATVLLLEEPAEETWLRRVGAEFNQPATVFVWPESEGYGIRWFTPSTELPLCGHGTLAAAHVLYENGAVPAGQPITFRTGGGTLVARPEGDQIWLELSPVELVEASAPDGLLDALGVADEPWFGLAENDFVVELDSPEAVERLQPNTARLRDFPVLRVTVTAQGGANGADFTSRVFAPNLGVDEDQVTGSAHCCLGPLWSRRLGRSRLTAVQASPRRGVLSVDVDGDRLLLGGRALSTYSGEFHIAP
ncbi:phenazine biosynthesis protein PhzF family [Streptoalloteichus tenebrarius]|uniref:Phenazine biosynthesis protein PhzF family n=1 Tax=Streptoalloteichus tenebrarius (strain ATCC 17920 / DSM 40477 / JCM 4838 / CBS 697.72 / NBRC 16177 / NCIMB 11028 / NRRL B-12390 / A12253. 1 / ISP 5477) TaxID=1933 RepID=A0ABT1I274_STRSD|nr:PhzF family phenazine biosynthesis protein [Streptoalloteichus tenebrarius]MCP2261883.1 phenazine biosynthesis protein PhzF family [Streptoalloteichus tenebrarius]BFF01054.1 PhzF family phenazine biosynthesis protein [Streptoalloteichus tenebrarius]